MNKPDLAALRHGLREASRRFDSRTQRERVLLGSAAAALAFMLADALWLTPAQKAYSAARAQQRQAQSSLQTMRQDLQRMQATRSAQAAQLQRDLVALRERVRAGDQALRAQQASLIGPEAMLPLLDQLLARHGQVRLRSMQSLPQTDVLGAAGAAERGASAALATTSAPSKAQPGLYRHGVELTLEGSYAGLLAYLQGLEALPQRLLWGGMQFKVEQYPKASLTLRLHTLSLERHWLEI